VRPGLLLALALAVLLPVAPAHALTDAGYLAFADRIAAGTRLTWDGEAYVSREKGPASRTNANMLLVHAVAALRGHAGPARQDERARVLVDRFTRSPAFRLRRVERSATRAVCWSRAVTHGAPDHISLDAQVAEALGWAWVARRQLGLSRAAAARIAAAVGGCARHRAWRYPHTLRNQFNWNAQLYATAAIVTGEHDLLRRDYRRLLLRFTAARPAPGMRVTNLGPGLSFRYSPHLPASRPTNFDTPEYANIVASGLQHLARARAGGMRPLPGRSTRLLRAWASRLLTGAWTHAGYLNWDTGHGRLRRHSGQYWAFAQQGLLAIAASPELWSRPAYGSWAKALFDRGLELYERWAVEAGGALAPRLPFGVWSAHRDQDLYAARMAANAARAVVLGLGRVRATDPPPLYAFDRDSGRLAVTTPRYSTAIVPHTNGAFAYGGIELARLFGAGQRVAANLGGMPPDAFGVVAGGVESQGGSGGRMRLLRPHPRGSFRVLDAVGTVRRRGVRITTRHRFRRGGIDERWTVRCGCVAEVHLPTRAGTAIELVLRDGARSPLVPGAALADVARIELGGYSATPARVPRGARLFPVATRPQRTAPDPGPTLAIRLRPVSAATVGLRLVPEQERVAP
jgi:hypothetical protein